MKYLIALFSASIFSLSTSAFAASPSQASIEKLLAITDANKILESIQQQVDAMMQNTMLQATRGQNASPEQQKILDEFTKKSMAETKEPFSPENLKSIYIQVYSENFSQEEIDQLIVFYESPTGKMFVKKMPLVTQESMSLIQQKMGPMLQKMQQAAHEMKMQLDALTLPPPK